MNKKFDTVYTVFGKINGVLRAIEMFDNLGMAEDFCRWCRYTHSDRYENYTVRCLSVVNEPHNQVVEILIVCKYDEKVGKFSRDFDCLCAARYSVADNFATAEVIGVSSPEVHFTFVFNSEMIKSFTHAKKIAINAVEKCLDKFEPTKLTFITSKRMTQCLSSMNLFCDNHNTVYDSMYNKFMKVE